MNLNYEIVKAWLRRDHERTDEENMARIANAYNITEWDVKHALREEGYLP